MKCSLKRLSATCSITLSLAAATFLTADSAFAKDDSPPDLMVKAQVRVTEPPSDIRRIIWRHGREQMRVEQIGAGRKPTWLTIVNSPDTWEINPSKKTGSHIIDDKPPTLVTISIFPGEPEIADLEIGNELEYFKSHQATLGKTAESKAKDRYELKVGKLDLALETIAGTDQPYRLTCKQCSKVKEIQYAFFERTPYQPAVFTAPKDIPFGTSTFAKGALDKPISTSNRNVTVLVTLTAVTVNNQTMPAWCYHSKGLHTLGQPEMIITVLKKTGEAPDDYPHDPISLINTIAAGKNTGTKIFSAGMFADVSGFLGEHFKGLVFVPAEKIARVEIGDGDLAAIPITAQEYAVCQMAGTSRVIGRLAQQATYYPVPTWCKRNRPTVFSDDDVAQMKRDPFTTGSPLFTSDASVILHRNVCTLIIKSELADRLADILKKSIAKKTSLRVSLQPGIRAKSFLVWQSEKNPRNRLAVGRGGDQDGSLSGQYLLIVPEQKEDRLDIIQDGFVLSLTTASWNKFLQALSAGGFSIPLMGGDAAQFTLSRESTSPAKRAAK